MDEIDLTSPQFKADPYPRDERPRTEAPVAKVRIGRRQFPWLITRYDDVPAALKDERLAVAGVSIPQGALVFAGIAAANRDPQQFDRPDILNLEDVGFDAGAAGVLADEDGLLDGLYRNLRGGRL